MARNRAFIEPYTRLDADLLDRLQQIVGRPPAKEEWLTELTPREVQIATLAAEGATNEHIAKLLWLSIETVKSHVRHALVKTGARNRTQLAVMVARQQAADDPLSAKVVA